MATYAEFNTLVQSFFLELGESFADMVKSWHCNKPNSPIPRWFWLLLSIDNVKLIKFLKVVGLLKENVNCRKCGKCMILKAKKSTDKFIWYCGKQINGHRCFYTRSIRDGSWFMGSHLELRTILMMTYDIVHKTPRYKIQNEYNVSLSAITSWTDFIWGVMIDYLQYHSEQIGGKGVTVEIDESRFGKCRFQKGHFVEGQWVLGGLDRNSGQMFLVAVQDRTVDTLTDCIRQWVKPETTIVTDCWKAHDRLGEECYSQLTVTHKVQFADSKTFIYPQKADGMWKHVKMNVPPNIQTKDSFPKYLAHYLFCKLILSGEGFGDKDPFLRFLYIVRQIDWARRTQDKLSNNITSTPEQVLKKQKTDQLTDAHSIGIARNFFL